MSVDPCSPLSGKYPCKIKAAAPVLKLSDPNRALGINAGDLAGLLTDVSLLQSVTGSNTFPTDCA